MGLNDLLTGKELIVKQTSSIKDLPSKGLKEFAPNNSWLEKKQIENQLEEQFNFIKADRIEKSNNLSQAQWIPHLKKAKVTKKVGKLWDTLGHHQDNEDWLLPEEALFLIENSELQLVCDNVSVSVEDCYQLVFTEGGCSLAEYRVFSYLSRAGLRVIRHSPCVSVTRYEKQVRLDSIVQSQKRPAPQLTSMDDITVIDDDVCIIEDSPAASSSLTAKPKNNIPEETIVLIESDDEEIKEIDIDSDSDIVCISSPSYNSADKNSRSWYPIVGMCLIKTLERVIDLCDEKNEFHDNKFNVRSRLELIRPRKEEILSRIPSLDGGVTTVIVADRRLLPTNAIPKYSEYKVNLNVRPDDTFPNSYNNENFSHFNRPSRPPLLDINGYGGFDNFGMNQNPLLLKAQQMQTMAMSMIQTAAQLMSSCMTPSNPNELWEQYPNRGFPVAPYNNNRFSPMNRPYTRQFGYQRRPRFQRRRYPYRKPVYNPHPVLAIQNKAPSSNSDDIVILSDGEDVAEQKFNVNTNLIEIMTESSAKRKLNANSQVNKRIKFEPGNDGENTVLSDSSSCIFDGEVENCKKEPEENIKKETGMNVNKESKGVVKNEPQEKVVVNKNVSVKSESDSVDSVRQDAVIGPITGQDKENCAGTNVNESQNINKESSTSEEDQTTETNDKSNQSAMESSVTVLDAEKETSSSKEATVGNTSKEDGSSNQETSGLTNPVEVDISKPCCSKDLDESVSVPVSPPEAGDSENTSRNEQPQEVSSWDQYKLRPEEMEEEEPDEESLVNFDQCHSYGNSASPSLELEGLNDTIPSPLPIYNHPVDDSGNILLPSISESDVEIEEFPHQHSAGISNCVQQIAQPLNPQRVTLITVTALNESMSIDKFDDPTPDQGKFNENKNSEVPFSKMDQGITSEYRVPQGKKPSDEVPTSLEMESLKIQYQDNIPFLFSVVFPETIGFYHYNTISLNTLCD